MTLTRPTSTCKSKPGQKCVITAHVKDTPLLLVTPGLTIRDRSGSYIGSSLRKGTQPHPFHLQGLSLLTPSPHFSSCHSIAHHFLSPGRQWTMAVGRGLLPTYGRMHGFTHWAGKDRQEEAGGGVVVCFKEGMQAQQLDIDTPPLMDVMQFRVMLAERSALLLYALYCPP
ncbi:hypothetical protein E2C01_021445 [Portunus trituberculatus]|uniref:Uncharacterized protein n=1 Tax=Portunus trituberculatus TaxID=210409 RepID=A0A5B7E4H6_PORTR|nr:hypothetical protein [Portunus trituberculatus]